MVPSLGDVKENKLIKIADDIKNAELNENASKLLAILEENMDMSQIALKLLSNLLKENTPVGPDKIGLDKKTLDNVVRNMEERDNNRGRNGGRRDGRGGGYRGNSGGSRDGGGYRGNRSGGSRDGGSRDSRPPRGDGAPRSDRGESRNPFAKDGGRSSGSRDGGGYKGNRDGGESRAPRAPRDPNRAPKSAPRNAYKKD